MNVKKVGFLVIASMFLFPILMIGQNKYIGTKMCAMCHKTDKQGQQLAIWEKSAHSKAYKTLLSEKANEIAKAKGLKKPAAESAECLDCHAPAHSVDAKLLEKGFDIKDGVQCENCHGAGSSYKAITVMKDKKKSVEAGMTDFKDKAAIEKYCTSCHNEKSPTYKEFKFDTQWEKIKHLVPKG